VLPLTPHSEAAECRLGPPSGGAILLKAFLMSSRTTCLSNFEEFSIVHPVALVIGLVVVGALLAGCGSKDTPKIETFQAPEIDPLVEARTMLKNYASGMPVTSEAESFPELVERVRKKDPAKADVLDKGLSEIKANPKNAASKAKELLQKL
jgi:hypothetical protein